MNDSIQRAPLLELALVSALSTCFAADALATQSWSRVPNPSGGTVVEIAVSPHDSDVMLVGLLHGIFRTVDAGGQWVGNSSGYSFLWSFSFDWHPTDPTIVLAGTRNGGLRSKDGGISWTEFFFGGDGVEEALSVRFDPVNVGTAYALVEATKGYFKHLYRSTDSGLTWTPQFDLDSARYNTIHIPPTGDVLLAGFTGLAVDGDVNP